MSKAADLTKLKSVSERIGELDEKRSTLHQQRLEILRRRRADTDIDELVALSGLTRQHIWRLTKD